MKNKNIWLVIFALIELGCASTFDRKTYIAQANVNGFDDILRQFEGDPNDTFQDEDWKFERSSILNLTRKLSACTKQVTEIDEAHFQAAAIIDQRAALDRVSAVCPQSMRPQVNLNSEESDDQLFSEYFINNIKGQLILTDRITRLQNINNKTIASLTKKSDPDLDIHLYNAAGDGDLKLVKALIAQGANVNSQVIDGRTRRGWTALMAAALSGRIEITKYLLSHGANVEAKMQGGETALFKAAGNGKLDIVRILIKANANVNAQDDNGNTVLIVAAIAGHEKIVRLLINAKADVNVVNNSGVTALMWPVEHGNKAIVKMLKAAGAKR